MSTEQTEDAVAEGGKKAPATRRRRRRSDPDRRRRHAKSSTSHRRSARPAARRRARRCRGSVACGVGAPAAPAGSRQAARGAGRDPRAGARADPLRADARLAVHVLPGRCVPDGVRPRRAAPARGCTPSSAAMRICRTSAFSPRPTGGSSSRINDFDETLPGPVRVGRQAAGRELRGRGPRPRFRCQDPGEGQHRGRPLVPRGDPGVRSDAQPGHLVRAGRHRGGHSRLLLPRHRRAAEAAWTRTSKRRGRRTA